MKVLKEEQENLPIPPIFSRKHEPSSSGTEDTWRVGNVITAGVTHIGSGSDDWSYGWGATAWRNDCLGASDGAIRIRSGRGGCCSPRGFGSSATLGLGLIRVN